jgi:hypothetical protein
VMASQADVDADGAGDACDCQPFDPTDRRPGDVVLSVGKTATTAHLTWPALGQADSYSVTRGDSVQLQHYGTCLADGVVSPGYDDPQVPTPGHGFYYLVQAQNFDCGLGPLGYMTPEQTRVNNDSLRCNGVLVADEHATSEATVHGTVSGDIGATQISDNFSESIGEALSTDADPGARFSRLEQRWTLSVGAGTTKEFHVEGSRTNSSDGDDFQFEYSTDGVNFTPLVLTLPLTSENVDIDRFAALPGTLGGTVTIRVVDTDRTAGHQTLDTVAIDELWIRVIP